MPTPAPVQDDARAHEHEHDHEHAHDHGDADRTQPAPLASARVSGFAPARSPHFASKTEATAVALALLAVLGLFIAYAAQHVWLCDDAFISFRYVRNLVEGHGLVWNRGERVEGYTNFLWVLELAALWKAFDLRPEHVSLPLTWLYTAGTLYVTARLAFRTPFKHARSLALVSALLLLTINRNFVVWTSSGLETRQFTFFVVLAVWLLQRDATANAFRTFVPASLAMAAAELTRPEGSLLFACGGLWLLGRSLVARSYRLRSLVGYALPFTLIVAAHYLFRHAYYGDFFPNTYYAKDVRPWPEAGFRYLLVASIESGLYLVLPVAALGLYARVRMARDGLHVLSAICLVLHAAYVVRIGGDHFEFRPLDFYWPLLSLASVDGLLWLRVRACSWLERRGVSRARLGSWVLLGASASVLIFYSTVLQLGHYRHTRVLTAKQRVFPLVVQLDRDNWKPARLVPSALLRAYNEALSYTAAHSVGTRFQEHRTFRLAREAMFGAYADKTRGRFPDDAVMSLNTIGVTSYHLADLTIVDVHGLTDRTVAHNPVLHPNSERQLAHDRSPPPGYLSQRGVNVSVLPASLGFGTASEYALRLDGQLWMPLTSSKPAWLREAFRSKGLWRKRLTGALSRNDVWIEGTPMVAAQRLGFFDAATLDEGWTAQGTAFEHNPRRKHHEPQTKPVGAVGAGFINTYHPKLRERATGTLLSPTWNAQAGDHLVFLVGGGNGGDVGVELRCDDTLVGSWRGLRSEELVLVEYDLTPRAGQRCQLRI